MPHKYNCNLTLVISFFCIAFLFTIPIQAQSESKEKPQIKDFGSSINPKKQRKKEKIGDNSEQSKKVDENDDVIKIDTRLVRTDVLVVDRRGKAVKGLKADDFVVTENNVQQEIGTFSLGENVEVPKSIVLIIDYSGSQAPFIRNSAEAAKILVDKLNPNDRMAIVTDDVEVLSTFTKDKNLLKKKLNSLIQLTSSINYDMGQLPKVGKSKQFSALMATLNEMFDAEDIRPIVIFQTDGDEVFQISRHESEEDKKAREVLAWDKPTNFTVADLFNSIEKSRATIYSVVTGISMLGLSPNEQIVKARNINNSASLESIKFHFERLYRQQKAMMIVSRASGGFTQSLEKSSHAETVYSKILNDINNRYLIGFYPKNEESDGKRRTVIIEVKGHPDYVISGRKTYVVSKEEK